MTTISKPFQLTVNPEPTFNGLLWVINGVHPGAIGTGNMGTFNAALSAAGPPNVASLFMDGCNGVYGTPITIPSNPSIRNCLLEITASFSGVINTSTLDVQVDGVSLPGLPHDGITSGVYSKSFALSAGVSHTFLLYMALQCQFSGGMPATLDWNGQLYVPSYS